jgi:hypothetical protein
MRIVGATLGDAIRIQPEGNGDVWATTWAGDGNLYSAADDAIGFGEECRSNLAVFRIEGEEPPHLLGSMVNPMSDYGALTELGPDHACWKANGLTCIEGVLYLGVSRHLYYAAPHWVQHAWDSSIVKSEDYGRTWSQAPKLGHSMFPGPTFGAPFFVQYGQDGEGSPDGADTYVYAVSSDGVWDNGSSMILGRVRRDRIAALDPADWEFVHRFDEDGQPLWTSRHDSASYTFRNPGRTSMTGIHYVSALGVYVMPQWYYTDLSGPAPDRWQSSQWELYQAPAPWGPWTLFHRQEFAPEGFYNPTIPAKFMSPDGRKMWILTAGDFATQAYYRLHAIPVTLDVEG